MSISEDDIEQIKEHYSETVCSAVQNEETKSFAGMIECHGCKDLFKEFSCFLVKSAYIFDSDSEAIKWAINLRKEIHAKE